MKIALFLSIVFAASSAIAFVDPGVITANQNAYYGAGFASKRISKDDLFNVLERKHTSVGYSRARKILFGELHGHTEQGRMFVEDVYCGKIFYYRTVEDISHMGNEVNIEHTWPQSKFNGRFNKDMQKSDMHHLFPTDSLANNRRGNFNFGNVSEAEDHLNVHDCDSSRLGSRGGKTVFAPPAQHRGNVARALFYFATRYQLDIPQNEEAILREWHLKDPVDDEERERHEAIVKHQQVRNPFVDFPEMVKGLPNL